jgi:hypothetical protein
MRPVWNAEKLKGTIAISWPATWLYDQPDALNGQFPRLIVRNPFMRQCTLCPTGVDEVEGAIFITHIEVGRFDHDPIDPRLNSALLSSCVD